MLKKLYNHRSKVAVSLLFVVGFALIRFNEEQLFYDPFLAYFKGEFNKQPLPEFDIFRLLLNLIFRYGLNMLLSLGLIYVLFKDVTIVKFSFILYLIAFVFLVTAFFFVIYFFAAENNFILFYVRRFLIQPVLVLLFIPAFYFQKLHG